MLLMLYNDDLWLYYYTQDLKVCAWSHEYNTEMLSMHDTLEEVVAEAKKRNIEVGKIE